MLIVLLPRGRPSVRPDDMRSLLPHSPHRAPIPHHSLARSSLLPVACPTCAACSTLLAPTCRVPPPTPLAPARRARQPPDWAKAGAGGAGGGGARAPPLAQVLVLLTCRRSPPTLTSTTTIYRPRPPLYYKTHVSCFRGMLQVFHINVVKVDRDVAYVAMAIHINCKRVFQMFHQFIQTYVASVFI
jgi:hypothetical protein